MVCDKIDGQYNSFALDANLTADTDKNDNNFLLPSLENFPFSRQISLGLVLNETYDLLIEHLFLAARYHIYASKRKNIVPKLQTFIELTANNAEVEKRYAYETNTLANYSKKWSRLSAFLFSRH